MWKAVGKIECGRVQGHITWAAWVFFFLLKLPPYAPLFLTVELSLTVCPFHQPSCCLQHGLQTSLYPLFCQTVYKPTLIFTFWLLLLATLGEVTRIGKVLHLLLTLKHKSFQTFVLHSPCHGWYRAPLYTVSSLLVSHDQNSICLSSSPFSGRLNGLPHVYTRTQGVPSAAEP